MPWEDAGTYHATRGDTGADDAHFTVSEDGTVLWGGYPETQFPAPPPDTKYVGDAGDGHTWRTYISPDIPDTGKGSWTRILFDADGNFCTMLSGRYEKAL